MKPIFFLFDMQGPFEYVNFHFLPFFLQKLLHKRRSTSILFCNNNAKKAKKQEGGEHQTSCPLKPPIWFLIYLKPLISTCTQ